MALIKYSLRRAIVCALVCMPILLYAQSITLGGAAAVASAQDFATLSFQDPWDMNARTDFGWFLHGADLPSPELINVSFSNGIFSATTGNGPNLFLLETGNPNAARLGKTGYNHPIDANFYKLIAIRPRVDFSSLDTVLLVGGPRPTTAAPPARPAAPAESGASAASPPPAAAAPRGPAPPPRP